MTIYGRIKVLAERQKLSIRSLEEKLGYGNGTIRRWEKQVPGVDKVQRVADYFNVSVDYLLGRDEQDTNTDNEIDLTGIAQPETEEKIFSYEGKEISKKDLELIRRILETGEYDE